MALFTREHFAEPDDEAGVFIDKLGVALVTWRAMQDKTTVTVHDAAAAFNTTAEVITEAVHAAELPWLYLIGEDIELDGE